MGIIIHDELTLPSGLKVIDSYAGFASNLITVTPFDSAQSPTGKMYNIQAPYNIWVSNACRTAGNDPLMTKQLAFAMGPSVLMEGVYTILYGQLCSNYTNFTNTDTPPPSQATNDTNNSDSSAPAPAASS